MEDIKTMARAAKRRLKTDFWAECAKNIAEGAEDAKLRGVSERQVKSTLKNRVKSEINGEKQDEFYLKVKNLLDTEGEVSDAIGRLTDKKLYESLSYEERQRYNLELSSKYRKALARYRRDKELGL